MGLILLEALLALLLLLLIVWWTMFSGREKGELKSDRQNEVAQEKKSDTE
jgi:cbb3-type cytochrome oxidase subunit 3